jgi:hypothetical protein
LEVLVAYFKALFEPRKTEEDLRIDGFLAERLSWVPLTFEPRVLRTSCDVYLLSPC